MAGEPIFDVFAAADVSTLAASTSTLVVAFVGISLIFVAYRYAKKAGIK